MGETVCHSVNVFGDDIRELNEFFRVQLEAGDSNDAFTGNTFVRITIMNDGDSTFIKPSIT